MTRIQKNTISIILMMGLIKLSFFLRDIFIAHHFGVSKDVDIYLFALVIPMFLYNTIGGSFYVYFIPTYMKIKTDSGPDRAKEYFSRLAVTAIPVLAAIAIFSAWVLPDLLLKINNVSYNSNDISIFHNMSKWAAIFFFLFTISSFFVSLLQAEHRYVRSFIPQILIPVCSIWFIINYSQTFSVASALYGTTIGAAICFLTLCIYSQKVKIFQWLHSSSSVVQTKTNIEQFFILIVSSFLPNLVNMIDRQVAINLGEGKLTALNYGLILPGGLLEIFLAGLGIALYTYFSQWFAEQKKHLMIEATQKVIICTISFIAPLCLFLILFARPIIAILFERGTFTDQDTATVAPVLQCYSMTLVFAIVGIIGARIISTTNKNQVLLILGVILFIFKMILNTILIKFFDFYGIPLATVLMYFLMGCIIFRYLHHQQFRIFSLGFSKQIVISFLPMIGALFSFIVVGNFSNDLSDLTKILFGLFLLITWLVIAFGINKHFMLSQYKKPPQNA